MDDVGRTEIAVTPDGTAAVGKRARKRDSLFLSARLRFGDKPACFDTRVRNLSAGGLMAEHDQLVHPGTAVTLEMRGLGELTGTVAWCTHGRLGIAFDEPVDPARARKRIGSGKKTSVSVGPLLVTAPRR